MRVSVGVRKVENETDRVCERKSKLEKKKVRVRKSEKECKKVREKKCESKLLSEIGEKIGKSVKGE